MYEIYLTKDSEKELAKLSSADFKRVTGKLLKLQYPFPRNFDIKKLATRDFFRLRVGNVRVLFELDKPKREIWIRKIGYRGGVYK